MSGAGYLLLVALLAAGSTGAVTPPSAKSIKLSELGSCRSASGFADMEMIVFLAQSSTAIHTPDSAVRVSVVRDTVVVEDLDRPSVGKLIYYVRDMVRKNDDPDVKVQLILVNGEVAVYWRETFLHRQYRQGIFNIRGNKLVPLCEGIGGFTTIH